jgi:hypothetical protein
MPVSQSEPERLFRRLGQRGRKRLDQDRLGLAGHWLQVGRNGLAIWQEPRHTEHSAPRSDIQLVGEMGLLPPDPLPLLALDVMDVGAASRVAASSG